MTNCFLFAFFLWMTSAHAAEFYRHVKSSAISAECDASEGEERGPFGIDYADQEKEHSFLVMTGVYYDTCKDLENRVDQLKKKYKHLLLQGTESSLKDSTHIVWIWKSIKSPDGKYCVSYFLHDCK